MTRNRVENTNSYVVLKRPDGSEATFYSQWLVQAGLAEALWREALSGPCFYCSIEGLLVPYIPDFARSADEIINMLKRRPTFIAVPMAGEVEEITIMVLMGFFSLTEDCYHPVVPDRLDLRLVKSAARRLVRTMDSKHCLHPEHFVRGVPAAKLILLNINEKTGNKWSRALRSATGRAYEQPPTGAH